MSNANRSQLLLSLHHATAEQYEDAAAVWAEKSDAGNNYKACAVEMRQMSGLHSDISAVSLLLGMTVSTK